MWLAWVVVVVAGAAASFFYWRMRPLIKALGKNFIDATPRFSRHELEKVRGQLEHHKDLLGKHKQLTALDLWMAPHHTPPHPPKHTPNHNTHKQPTHPHTNPTHPKPNTPTPQNSLIPSAFSASLRLTPPTSSIVYALSCGKV